MAKSIIKDENTHILNNIFLVNRCLQIMDLGMQLRFITTAGFRISAN